MRVITVIGNEWEGITTEGGGEVMSNEEGCTTVSNNQTGP